MSTNQNAAPATVPEPTAPANLHDARKEMAAAKKRHPAGAKGVPAKKAPAKAVTERKTPTQSGRPKLRWKDEIAKVGDVEIGRRVEQSDGTFNAVVRVGGKSKVIAEGLSRERAYYAVVDFYHRDRLPETKTATPKAAS